jgi:hypothetical protein
VRFEITRQRPIVAGQGRRFQLRSSSSPFAAEARGAVFFIARLSRERDPLMNLNALAIAFVAIVATLPLSAAVAQTPPPSVAADTAAIVPPEEPKKPLTRKEARALKAKAGARLCLEFPTDLMVVMCAEKYR